MSALAGWANFYLVTGTAAATLTGLQFIVQTLLASDGLRRLGDDPESGISAFGSPTVVHLSLALLVSALMCAPWSEDGGLRATLGLLGVGALAYSVVVLRRTRRQRSYVPTAEDWLRHILLPTAAYAALLLAALILEQGGLFAVAAATLLLIFVAIHNAWDTITYLVVALRTESAPAPGREEAP